MKQKYDFISPIQQLKGNKHQDYNNLEDFLTENFDLQQKKVKRKNRVFNLVIITILFLSFGSLAVFGYWQWNGGKVSKSQVAGIQDTLVKNIVSGDNFSLILSEKAPDGFEMTKKNIQSPFFEQKNVVNSSFIKKTLSNSGEIVSGIEIITSEYDFKLDQKAFATKIKENLGNNWEILSEDITLPGQVLLSKIQKKDKSQSYYTTATKNYYYVISIYQNKSEKAEINRFVENLLPSLNLN